MDENIAKILSEYDSQETLYRDFAENCEFLLKKLLTAEGYRVHSVTSRLKDRDKLEEKLRREGKSYNQICDVTDTAGVRIITHFEDEVDKIGTLIEREFQVDSERSIDKRKVLDPDRFGYLSLHYICGLNADRLKLAENRKYDGLPCEIQIRSILQHAWAEIEHDLGYKRGSTVPAPIRRRFSRLAGLLELADQEFKNIRGELEKYAASVEDDIRIRPSQVEIDNVSLEAFMHTDPLYQDLINAMASKINARIDRDTGRDLATELRYVGIKTVEDLREALASNKNLIFCQWARVIEGAHESSGIGEGLALLQLVIVAVSKGGASAIIEFFEKFGYRDPDMAIEESAARIIAAIEECSGRV
jgi:putative GTP pyrophosphokinase